MSKILSLEQLLPVKAPSVCGSEITAGLHRNFIIVSILQINQQRHYFLVISLQNDDLFHLSFGAGKGMTPFRRGGQDSFSKRLHAFVWA